MTKEKRGGNKYASVRINIVSIILESHLAVRFLVTRAQKTP